jgi:hypothetical protein
MLFNIIWFFFIWIHGTMGIFTIYIIYLFFILGCITYLVSLIIQKSVWNIFCTSTQLTMVGTFHFRSDHLSKFQFTTYLWVEMNSNETKCMLKGFFFWNFVFTYVYVVPFKWHVNHASCAWSLIWMLMKSKLNHYMFQFWILVWAKNA